LQDSVVVFGCRILVNVTLLCLNHSSLVNILHSCMFKQLWRKQSTPAVNAVNCSIHVLYPQFVTVLCKNRNSSERLCGRKSERVSPSLYALSGQDILLYLPTQIRFLIGGERVICQWSKLHDALGQTKVHDALGQQQLELSTRT